MHRHDADAQITIETRLPGNHDLPSVHDKSLKKRLVEGSDVYFNLGLQKEIKQQTVLFKTNTGEGITEFVFKPFMLRKLPVTSG